MSLRFLDVGISYDQVTWYCLQFFLTLLSRFEFTPGTEMTKFAVHTTLAALVMPKPCTGLASVWVPQNRMQVLAKLTMILTYAAIIWISCIPIRRHISCIPIQRHILYIHCTYLYIISISGPYLTIALSIFVFMLSIFVSQEGHKCRSDATVTRWTVPRTSGTWAVRPAGNKSRGDKPNIPWIVWLPQRLKEFEGHLVVPSRLSRH